MDYCGKNPNSTANIVMNERKSLLCVKRATHTSMSKSLTTEFIRLKGCRQNNLKNIDVLLPRYAITVITGVSGSGKSSLAFDTLFAEGQRRFLEYLSPQARQLIRQLPKPDVDLIEGLSPTLAVQQSRSVLPALSTVATHTDLYDFLCLLFARVGIQYSPITNQRLIRHTRQEIIEVLLKDYPEGSRLQLIAPITLKGESLSDAIQRLQKMGFLRMRLHNQEFEAGDSLPPDSNSADILEVVIDRIIMKEGIRERLGASVETAMDLSRGVLKVLEGTEGHARHLTEVFLCPESGLSFAPLEPADFNFHSARGACPVCQGRGGKDSFVETAFHYDPETSLYDQVLDLLDRLPSATAEPYQAIWMAFCHAIGLSEEWLATDVDASLLEDTLRGSSKALKAVVSTPEGLSSINTHWKGLKAIVEEDLAERRARSSFQTEEYVSWQSCPRCQGTKLKREALACRVGTKNIAELCALTADGLMKEIGGWTLEAPAQHIASEIIPEITSRLLFLQEVGLGYIELSRPGRTLSDGEAQRVLLASQIGAHLCGILYVLDEPSRGLHRRDIAHLAKVFGRLKDIGNTVVVVEHDPTLIGQADHIVEIGPGSGIHGGELVFSGTTQELLTSSSPTGEWLSGRRTLPKPKRRRKGTGTLRVVKATTHNLKNVTVDIPLGTLMGFCGVSGSGKSSLAIDVIAAELQRYLLRGDNCPHMPDVSNIERLQIVSQRPSGITARAMPATFVGLMTPLRQLFAKTKMARTRGYTASRFTTNKKGGRCDACEGLGVRRIDMEFMPDLYLICDVCQGKRYNYETLQVLWEGLSIADVLDLSVEKALEQFRNIPELANILTLMQELGLDYLTLGQSFTTLSGGEIQRLKLIAELARTALRPTLYVMDEPCVGLHFSDVAKLAKILHRLVDGGHSVIVVEHNLMLLRQCDWLIELGPEGGPLGGSVIFQGSPDKLAKSDTPTGQVLALSIS